MSSKKTHKSANQSSNVSFDEVLGRVKALKGLRFDYQVAELFGLTKSALAERKSRDSLPIDKLEIFCERNAVSLSWLLTGSGEKFKDTIPAHGNADYALVEVFALAGADKHRQLSVRGSAQTIAVPKTFVTDRMESVTHRGASMEPCLYDGATLGVDRADCRLISGGLYAVWLEGVGAVIKRIFIEPDRIIIKSENELHPATCVNIKDIDDNLILGRVKWVVQRL